jgi:hypothetical protein
MREPLYQTYLINKFRRLFPGCIILKNDSEYMPGIPDLLILFRDRWAMLEVKASEDSSNQPNQEWYVEKLNEMSFASFIYPENEEEVLYDLQRSFQSSRPARLS